MTVSYQYQVANSTRGGFTRLLFMWRGSLYKLIYRELFLFLTLFAALSAIYRYLLNSKQKKEFEQIVIYCDNFINLIPLSFVLGFYVSYVAQRWWQQYQAIPWPDKVMHLIALYVTGNDNYARMLRRSMMRYLNLSLILVLRSISSAVKKRFPTLDHVVDSGFMTSLELELFLAVPSSEFNTYWIPCTWFINLLKDARQNQRTPDPQGLKLIMEEFCEFRTKCGMLWSYDWISIPLVYTQVVTLATYSFFAVALIARQYIDGKEKQFQLQIDVYIPVFTILQFFFFMGLLKVAEQLINPFGDDDEDFELNWIIDRHTKVSYLGVDTLMNRCPPLVKDIYFDDENLILPYTEAAAAYKKKTYRGSVANMTVPEEKQTMFLPDVIEENEEDVKPSLHTSTMSLATHNESPSSQRRQISSRAETPTKTDETCSETIVQFDIQESPSRIEQAEQRFKLTETMRKVSSLGRHSISQSEHTRKPFFTLTKSPKMQPGSSTSNLSKTSRQIIDTPTVYISEENPWGEYTSHVLHPPSLEALSDQFSETGKQCGFENTQLPDTFNLDTSDSSHSDTCQLQCHHTNMCPLRPSDINLSIPAKAATPKAKSPKYLVRRHKSLEAGKKKGIQWKKIIKTYRKEKPEDILVVEEMIPYTRSSPNLKHLDKCSQTPVKDTSDDDMGSPSKKE
ncbi:bestrophin-4-like [Osmia bicornis bicornis]|uniref:bestrophin-4-like n=1 Tax=Osmia bicornis bicornis TaxID=1437191 RepID=UPI0010F8CB80|nr:bestrophin-4-like [Osmia bicornis bicornis]XP_029036651.1 bestrophin-4-like [Osmia bicornis bicornis]XP_029036652.1 bestrophin-4-like [Osmia bicornis bicornis]XP_029036654.1 bestrophin-4-like [Osmia bicornis bicornis]XP_029036656.1 bestrophin-4-like [Osmia bicornis bicornis]XP_029036657.1 bestrophin-4-like [Osmia bicornis bicornis]XP_029036658.1 bestrophin-4-like [Osmia bicornis bicornis]XP_029036659.1 bestrophin-4-like [Osmia bicornis bicornis]